MSNDSRRAAPAVEQLVDDELGRIEDKLLVAAMRSLLVSPRCEDRPWDYGVERQTYPCWIVLEHEPTNTAIAYCDQGFGPSAPWGLLFLTGDHLNMGMDAGWYAMLQDAFRACAACDIPPPRGYEVR